MFTAVLLGLSAALLYAGGAYTARNAFRSHSASAWVIVTGGLWLMAGRQSLDLYSHIASRTGDETPMTAVFAFAIATLFLAGIVLVSRGSREAPGGNASDQNGTTENLRQTKSVMTSILDALPVSITVVDADGRYTFVNRFEANRWHYDPDTVIGKSAYEVLPPVIAEKARSQDRKVFETGVPIPFFQEGAKFDGRDRAALIGKIPLTDDAGAVEFVCMIGLDISDQVDAMEALEQTSAGYRTTLEMLPDAVYVTVDRRIVFANRVARDLFGAGDDRSIIGIASMKLFHPDMHQKLEADRQNLSASKSVNNQHLYRRLDGTEFQGAGSAALITWEGQDAMIAVVRDITAQLEKNAELETARQNADLANSAKSYFLASMSHEIRTPLNGILGMANILQDSPLTETQHKQIGTIVESGNLLLTLLNDILDISKIEAGGLEIENIDFDLAALLLSTSDIWSLRTEEKGLSYLYESDALLAPILNADPTRIRQILFNLLSNALKFTAAGVITLRVAQKNLPSGMIETRFEISDTGEGISEENIAKLFAKFSQADSSVTRRHGGTGLGLSISKELAEAMGGLIGVDSTPGQGSTFWFTISCGAGDPAKVVAERAPLDDGSGTRALDILVAEDNNVNQMVIRAMLEKAGHQVEIVENGIEAVNAVTSRPYDIVLMDIQMPKLDGMSATRRIREIDGPESDIPIIALTANAMKGSREEYLHHGMNEYISKPIEPGKLNAVLRSLCGADVSATESAIEPERRQTQPDAALADDLSKLFDDFEN
jgi:PAS domain S-box-containing protein